MLDVFFLRGHVYLYASVLPRSYFKHVFAGPLWGASQRRFLSSATLRYLFFFHVLQPLTVKLRGKVSLGWESKERKKKTHLNIISSFIFQRCSCRFFSLTSALWWFQTASLMTPLVRLHQCLYFKDWSSLPVIPFCRCLYDNTKLSSCQ